MKALVALTLVLPLAAGCVQGPSGAPTSAPKSYAELGFQGDATGTHPEKWPRLDGVTLTVLDHGAFGAFSEAKKRFEALTGATVVELPQDDTGAALALAIREKGSPSADVIFGLDDILLPKAVAADILEPFTPQQATRVVPAHRLSSFAAPWPATPADFGYIAVNWDNHTLVNGAPLSITSLSDVAAHADLFVTQDPRTSSVGLPFLLITIAMFGESDTGYDWRDYWIDLFLGPDHAEGTGDEALVTSGWTEAYVQHFSRGYGLLLDPPGKGDKSIVVSYTESPAAEVYFQSFPTIEDAARPLVAYRSTWEQVETTAILRGTRNLAAAQAWIEFTLTDAFQELAASYSAVYPVVATVDANDVFGTMDPEPGTFIPANLGAPTITQNLDRWVSEWRDLCERYDRCP